MTEMELPRAESRDDPTAPTSKRFPFNKLLRQSTFTGKSGPLPASQLTRRQKSRTKCTPIRPPMSPNAADTSEGGKEAAPSIPQTSSIEQAVDEPIQSEKKQLSGVTRSNSRRLPKGWFPRINRVFDSSEPKTVVPKRQRTDPETRAAQPSEPSTTASNALVPERSSRKSGSVNRMRRFHRRKRVAQVGDTGVILSDLVDDCAEDAVIGMPGRVFRKSNGEKSAGGGLAQRRISTAPPPRFTNRLDEEIAMFTPNDVQVVLL